ncbi:hypothetical protein C0J52_09505 [Blattella germanica]|nr:hypothetical protein C0J52_09505 [Blattella germanica]
MAEDSTNEFGQKSPECKLYRRRFFMLFIFVCFAVMNSFQWIQYSILANIVEAYYDVGSVAVDWTSMIFMVAIVLLMIPSSHFLDRKGGEQFAGELGFILIVSGMIGGVIFGIILDKTYRYK